MALKGVPNLASQTWAAPLAVPEVAAGSSLVPCSALSSPSQICRRQLNATQAHRGLRVLHNPFHNWPLGGPACSIHFLKSSCQTGQVQSQLLVHQSHSGGSPGHHPDGMLPVLFGAWLLCHYLPCTSPVDISLKKIFRERQTLYDITYMWNLKNTTN